MMEGGCDRTAEFVAGILGLVYPVKEETAICRTDCAIAAIRAEVFAQNAKWGANRHMPSTTEQFWGDQVPRPEFAKSLVKEATQYGELTWEDILFEELCEAHAEKDSIEDLCTELIQSAAVIVQWVADLRRGHNPDYPDVDLMSGDEAETHNSSITNESST